MAVNVAPDGRVWVVNHLSDSVSIVDPGANLKPALNDAIAMYGYPDIGTNIALGVRTVFASIPYFLDGFVTSIAGQLQAIVDQDIFLISALAGLTELAVQFTGDILVGVTQAIARVVATLTGSGVIAPTDEESSAGGLLLEVTLQTEGLVGGFEHLVVHRSVR